MYQRTLFSGSGSARSGLLLVFLLDFLLVENIFLALFVGANDIHSLFLLGLQIPHLFTLLFTLTSVAYYHNARLILGILFVIFLLAMACDVISVIIHSILAYKADTLSERRNEIVYSVILFIMIAVDALGVHFVDRLRDAFAHEQKCLADMSSIGTTQAR